ncbi:hypothetical protein HPT25_12945 [Bacillus sp. BRMEA1]|uniref:hypothetical protein n=1 Tax=Neobacillus endophyticus TaxID=2738405 RepID=UPI0015642671|nr:hypothetical protein [Neobacillus endophyticus]NRD78274.1 hypothetical protein [Neobacillus endophyticus]
MKKGKLLWKISPYVLFLILGFSLQKDPITFFQLIKVLIFTVILGSIVGLIISAIYHYIYKKSNI